MAVLVLLWISAIFSAVIDNIPFTATMLPIVAYLSRSMPGIHGAVLWWALCLGACLGGNGTLIGASANVVTAGLAEKAGHPVSFARYLRVAVVPTLMTVVLCTFWLLAAESWVDRRTLVWHIYGTVFRPAVKPMNPAWWSGKMPKPMYDDEHPAGPRLKARTPVVPIGEEVEE
jgi:hypothetical protein